MKFALYGGTFNPIHVGHLIVAEEVRQRFLLDRVYFIPSALPPHKKLAQIASPFDRFLMVNLATASNPSFFTSSVEIDRGGRSYSIETVKYFQERFGSGGYFLMGLDAFWEISTWKNFTQLLTSCKLIITSRPGTNLQDAINNLPKILVNHHRGLHFAFCRLEDESMPVADRGEDLFFVEVPGIDISSTMLRTRASLAGSLRYLVPPAVEEYIKKHSLYVKGES